MLFHAVLSFLLAYSHLAFLAITMDKCQLVTDGPMDLSHL